MRSLLALGILLLPVTVAAQQPSTSASNAIRTYAGTLHEQLSSACELIRPVTLTQYEQYDALVLAGESEEIYSPELRKGDFLALPPTAPKEIAKSAKKSGFDVRVQSAEPFGLNAEPVTNGSSCLNSQGAIGEANGRRRQRRAEVQARVHTPGFSDVLRPVPIRQVQPAPNQQLPPGSRPKVKEGATTLTMIVGIDGQVHDVAVVQSLDAVLDQTAIEAVQKWEFLPGRMKGLPVPVRIAAEFNFHLY